MIYGVSIVFYCLVCNDQNTSTFKKMFIGVICCIFSIYMTFTMIFNPQNPVFFFVSFAICGSITFYFSFKFSLRFKDGLKVWVESALIILFSFAVWNLENSFCSFFENFYLHSVWHLVFFILNSF
jgi:hypothetical protein